MLFWDKTLQVGPKWKMIRRQETGSKCEDQQWDTRSKEAAWRINRRSKGCLLSWNRPWEETGSSEVRVRVHSPKCIPVCHCVENPKLCVMLLWWLCPNIKENLWDDTGGRFMIKTLQLTKTETSHKQQNQFSFYQSGLERTFHSGLKLNSAVVQHVVLLHWKWKETQTAPCRAMSRRSIQRRLDN